MGQYSLLLSLLLPQTGSRKSGSNGIVRNMDPTSKSGEFWEYLKDSPESPSSTRYQRRYRILHRILLCHIWIIHNFPEIQQGESIFLVRIGQRECYSTQSAEID
jgi:hypothetical protein